MNKIKLNIEIHPTSKEIGLNYSKANTTSNLKNLKLFKNLYKAKLEDRHRIKGISFSKGKKEFNHFSLYRLKKNSEAATFEINEANYIRSLRDYNNLKHEIYLKEQKEKKLITNEALLNEKIIKKDINYTFLKETLYQFMRFKKNHINYNTNLLKNKDEIKRANKIAKSNFINKTMKSVTRKFHQITGKINMGKIHNEEMLNEKEYDDLIEQISKSRLKHLKSFQALPNDINSYSNSKSNKDIATYEPFRSRKTQEYTYKNKKFISYFQNNEQEDKNESQDEKELLFNLLNSYKKNYEKNGDKSINNNYPPICQTETNTTKNIKRKRFSESGKYLNINFKSNSSKKENNRAKSTKYKTYLLANPIELKENYKRNKIKSNIFNIRENEKENDNNSISSNTIKESLLNKNKNDNNKDIEKLNESSLIIKDIINLERIKKNNIMRERHNQKYWNKTKRIKTAISRNQKVINKPLYVSKISDFIKEYKRIKSVSKTSKKKMQEKHFTTLENIEKISQTKEDLLMFILKMKYFHCAFPQKKSKTISKKELFMRKLRNYLDIIDNPYSLATRQLKTEMQKEYNENY